MTGRARRQQRKRARRAAEREWRGLTDEQLDSLLQALADKQWHAFRMMVNDNVIRPLAGRFIKAV